MIAVALAFSFLVAADIRKPCSFSVNQLIRIRGRADDPAVFLWIRNLRVSGIGALRTFESGQGDDMFVFLHTKVMETNTMGRVIEACPDGDRENLGVRVISGPLKGQFGFIEASEAAYPP